MNIPTPVEPLLDLIVHAVEAVLRVIFNLV